MSILRIHSLWTFIVASFNDESDAEVCHRRKFFLSDEKNITFLALKFESPQEIWAVRPYATWIRISHLPYCSILHGYSIDWKFTKERDTYTYCLQIRMLTDIIIIIWFFLVHKNKNNIILEFNLNNKIILNSFTYSHYYWLSVVTIRKRWVSIIDTTYFGQASNSHCR